MSAGVSLPDLRGSPAYWTANEEITTSPFGLLVMTFGASASYDIMLAVMRALKSTWGIRTKRKAYLDTGDKPGRHEGVEKYLGDSSKRKAYLDTGDKPGRHEGVEKYLGDSYQTKGIPGYRGQTRPS